MRKGGFTRKRRIKEKRIKKRLTRKRRINEKKED